MINVNKKLYLFIISFIYLFTFVSADISIIPFNYLVYDYNIKIKDKFILKNSDNEFDFVKLRIRNKYPNIKLKENINDIFILDNDFYKIKDVETLDINYKINSPKNLKKELAFDLSFELESSKIKGVKQVFTTAIYVLPRKKKKNIKVISCVLKGNKIFVDIQNKGNFHFRPKIKLISEKGKKIIYFYDSDPVFPDFNKVFESYEVESNILEKEVFLLKILDKKNGIDFTKKIKIKVN
jgi:hypothetical protein